jgi:hypothetical protein
MRELPVVVVVAISVDTVVVPAPFIAATTKYIGELLMVRDPPGLVELAAAKLWGGDRGTLMLQDGKPGMICVLLVPPCLKGLGGVNDVAAELI